MCTPDGRMLDTRIFRSFTHKTVRFASPNIEFVSVPARHVCSLLLSQATSRVTLDCHAAIGGRPTPGSKPVFTLEIVHTLSRSPGISPDSPRSEAPLLARSFCISGVYSHSLYIGDWRGSTDHCSLQWPKPEDRTMEVCPWKPLPGARLQDGDPEWPTTLCAVTSSFSACGGAKQNCRRP